MSNTVPRMRRGYDPIGYIRRTIQGAWEIWGDIGSRQYFFYTKKEAIRRYRIEAWETDGQFSY